MKYLRSSYKYRQEETKCPYKRSAGHKMHKKSINVSYNRQSAIYGMLSWCLNA